MTPSSSRVEGIHHATQALAVAQRLFRQKGYLAASPEELAEAAGLTLAEWERQTGGKEALLWEIASHAADEFFAALAPILHANEPTPTKLRRAIVAHVRVITDHLDAAAVYFNEWRHLSEPRRSEFARRRDEYEALFRGFMREGIVNGIFAPVDEKFAALLVLSAMNWTHQWYRPDGPMSAEEIGRTLADLLCNGLYRTA